MFAQQRHQAIVQKLEREKSVKASELIELFGVSFETIRRDLEHLEAQGALKRVHGGAISNELDYSREIPLPVRETAFRKEKSELAEIASRYVSEGQSIAMDVSTTNTEFAKLLKTKFERLTVITNSLPIANVLVDMPHYTIVLIGGVIRNAEQSVIGDLAEQFAARFHPDLFFMSMSGVTIAEGITDFGIGEIQVKKTMLRNAKRTIALADSSKFDCVSLTKICGAGEVERFVTDPGIDRAIVERYARHGIEIVFE
ncbi:DeoR/GlpR family DNA-binding transcription regulator [Paenibacillus flagellatus]|uniref:DeoR/GlpR transcriptional regulator n=1 Tax=Paenibacillus flagellatus TaxID=2211139 RepID=A0A2V5K714_9BACL|nr:DeoR/GlpR family DNA-binding transcription regulator [Paenibacillus flagellatus]PYI53603.1 DeoR/GlpR transcriptional regulator [Paenibacillus flagellatus]